MGVRRALSVIMCVIGRMGLVMFVMVVAVRVLVTLLVSVITITRVLAHRTLPLDPGFTLAASANRAHRSISALAPGEPPTRRATGVGFPQPGNRTGREDEGRTHASSRAIAGGRCRTFIDTAKPTLSETR